MHDIHLHNITKNWTCFTYFTLFNAADINVSNTKELIFAAACENHLSGNH